MRQNRCCRSWNCLTYLTPTLGPPQVPLSALLVLDPCHVRVLHVRLAPQRRLLLVQPDLALHARRVLALPQAPVPLRLPPQGKNWPRGCWGTTCPSKGIPRPCGTRSVARRSGSISKMIHGNPNATTPG